MSRVLLDTHVFLWWIDQPGRVLGEWLDTILDPNNEVHVSAVSVWEIETRKRRGKLRFDHEVPAVVSQFQFEHLSVSMEHAALSGSLNWDHRDPFDRMLVAQALSHDMVLLSADDAIKSAPGVRVL